MDYVECSLCGDLGDFHTTSPKKNPKKLSLQDFTAPVEEI